MGCDRDRGRTRRSNGRATTVDRRGARAAHREEVLSPPEGLRRLSEPVGPHRAGTGRPRLPGRLAWRTRAQGVLPPPGRLIAPDADGGWKRRVAREPGPG